MRVQKGDVFHHWTVLEWDSSSEYGKTGKRNNPSQQRHLCQCICGKVSSIIENNLIMGYSKSCGCVHRKYNTYLETGEKFNQLTVTEVDVPRNLDRITQPSRWYYLCTCDCGKLVSVCRSNLTNSHTHSCGCLNKIKTRDRCKKYNKIKQSNGIVTVMFNNSNKSFIIDKCDYPLIKEYCWSMSSGYAVTTMNKKTTRLHRFLMGFPEDKVIDHINQNKLDNRRVNLRICNQSDNLKNLKISIKNTSGKTGVYFDKRKKRWIARIAYNKKPKYVGSSKSFEKACLMRRQAEHEFYGEYAPKDSTNDI